MVHTKSCVCLQGSFEHFPCRHGRCINGVVYYEAWLKPDCTQRFVMSFHVRSEKFNMIKVSWRGPRGLLLAYQGKLAYHRSSHHDAFISLWVLEDAERHEWSFKHFSLPFPLKDPISKTTLCLGSVTDAGEFIYVPQNLLGPFHALYFDPKTNTVRRVIYQGVADDEFRRRHGLGNKTLEGLHIFPDHIESLLSM
ncbi:unnamed protein product [Arabidopsis lyrata]|uniref:F-box associated beta-propeller type 3 domain-containing protein n=1 Tax=Arabidopsis lyrata subsp. lyrata TaxID=81972 RepID=D7LJ94_ARALL|nr:hypothetical protein ARALYDRAFT_902818 [Arabidopsis lyrata subsp. lyrata]CAH8264971.1 unnamed protein product [Arabidopsis lyrata]